MGRWETTSELVAPGVTADEMRVAMSKADAPRLLADERRLPGARMVHRHELEPDAVGTRLTNTISIEGPLAWLWSRVIGPQARRGLPEWQAATVALAQG